MKGYESLYPLIRQSVQQQLQEFDSIPIHRRERLTKLSRYIAQHIEVDAETNLLFVCTHNARRSQMAQLWAHISAIYFNIPMVQCFSGGSTSTQLSPNVIPAMEQFGLKITRLSEEGTNPVYEAHIGEDLPWELLYSKTIDSQANPTDNFAAIMVCSDADEACPIVIGCDLRISLPYDDPKIYDGTDNALKGYVETARLIGREMIFAFSEVQGART